MSAPQKPRLRATRRAANRAMKATARLALTGSPQCAKAAASPARGAAVIPAAVEGRNHGQTMGNASRERSIADNGHQGEAVPGPTLTTGWEPVGGSFSIRWRFDGAQVRAEWQPRIPQGKEDFQDLDEQQYRRSRDTFIERISRRLCGLVVVVEV